MNNEEIQSQLDEANDALNIGNYQEAERKVQDVLMGLDPLSATQHLYRGRALRLLGMCATYRGDNSNALEYLQASLQSSEMANDKVVIAKTLNNIGNLYYNLSEYTVALEYYGKSLSIMEELNDKQGIAAILGNIGSAYWNLSDYPKALEFLLRSLAMNEEIGEKRGIAGNLHNIGNLYRSHADYDKALEYYQAALEINTEIENKSWMAKNYAGIGSVYSYYTDYTKANEYLGKAMSIAEELGEKEQVAEYLGNIGNIFLAQSDYEKALEYYHRAIVISEQIGNKYVKSHNLGRIGIVYQETSDYSQALVYFTQSLELQEEIGDKNGVAGTLDCLGVVYENLGEYAKSLEYHKKALVIGEEIDNKRIVANVLGNMGIVYRNLADYPNALDYFSRALALTVEINNTPTVALWLGNIGSTYISMLEYQKGLEYSLQGMQLLEELDKKFECSVMKCRIGTLYANADFSGYDEHVAMQYLHESITMCESIGGKNYDAHKVLAGLYKRQGRLAEAINHLEEYHRIEKEVQSEDARKQANHLEQRRQAAEREKEIAIERTRATAEKRILNNILPEEITARLIKGENPIADHFDSVSVLFMDIVNFTPLASLISAQQLVHLLNVIFSATDSVIRECGLEKIKTIGDAYMAVAGAPVIQADHTLRAARAAVMLLDRMQNLVVTFPDSYGDRSWIESIPEIQVRIGLHCGPAAAGVVGENKFLYDLWGDAVNIASRMESHGEAGKIHVSEEFKHAVETLHATSLQFIRRGEMEIKGKGKMHTYFLEKAEKYHQVAIV